MSKNKYERLIDIIDQNYAESKKVNKAVELLIEVNLTDIKKEHYEIIENFIVFVAVNTDTSEKNKRLLDKPLDYIRAKKA